MTYYCIPLYPAPLKPMRSAQAFFGKRGAFGPSLSCRSASSVLVPRLRSLGSPRPLFDFDFPPRCASFGASTEPPGVVSDDAPFGVMSSSVPASGFTRLAPKESASISGGRLTPALGEGASASMVYCREGVDRFSRLTGRVDCNGHRSVRTDNLAMGVNVILCGSVSSVS